MNVRPDEKRVFDVLQKWWSFHDGRTVAQWDGFSILLAHYLQHADLPVDLLAVLRE